MSKKIVKINKGIGAGGANTTKMGLSFEKLTCNEETLIKDGYVKGVNKSLSKCFEDKTVTYVCQGNFKKYVKTKYNINVFRHPDEAYIIEYKDKDKKNSIKILEKKNQNVEGYNC